MWFPESCLLILMQQFLNDVRRYLRDFTLSLTSAGNRRPIIGPGNARDHIVEQLNPVTTWGREFYTIPIKVRDRLTPSTDKLW